MGQAMLPKPAPWATPFLMADSWLARLHSPIRFCVFSRLSLLCLWTKSQPPTRTRAVTPSETPRPMASLEPDERPESLPLEAEDLSPGQ